MSDAEDEAPRSKRLKDDKYDDKNRKRLIVVLESARLETGKIGKSYELLSGDKHRSFLLKHGKKPEDYRPDITHQCLLMLMDSPLNRAKLLQVYVHTEQNVLIQINPATRIPRTYERFAGLMVQLLHKLTIRADESSQILLKIIKNPVVNHLPVGCRKVGTSVNGTLFPKFSDLVPKTEEPIVYVIGAMAHGKVNVNYTESEVKLSSFPLSAALACAKLCHIFEESWDIR